MSYDALYFSSGVWSTTRIKSQDFLCSACWRRIRVFRDSGFARSNLCFSEMIQFMFLGERRGSILYIVYTRKKLSYSCLNFFKTV